MTGIVRLRTTAGVVVVGTVEKVTEHQFELVRVAVEDRDGKCEEYDPFRMKLAKVQVLSLVVSAATDGRNILVDNEGLLAAHEAAMRLRNPGTWTPAIEIRACPIDPAVFAKELCEMEAAA